MDRKTKRQLEKKGYKTYRFKDNPEELRFVMEWEERQQYGHLVDHMLSDGSSLSPPPASDEARRVAAVVIQWLGTPVGQGFLRDLGYVNVGRELSQFIHSSIRKDQMVTLLRRANSFEKQMKEDPDSILPLKKRKKVIQRKKKG